MDLLINDDPFADFPPDNIFNIALYLAYGDILKFRSVSKKFAEIVNNYNFWQNKAFKDFGISSEKFADRNKHYTGAYFPYMVTYNYFNYANK